MNCTDEQIIAWCKEVGWTRTINTQRAARTFLDAPTLTAALSLARGFFADEWEIGDTSGEVRHLRRLAGIDDDRELVERMAEAIRDAEENEGTMYDAARAALAVVRKDTP